ncbi:MAG TPA: sugar phosphate isomerase/epimerase [Planctomycetes bacterium]|jgi:sugar phosphate isomerase/epimerase|nr:sugar phosphate isomerase/epimerase [Planctomycetaceae bacterium]HIM31063.1 sugar phosphate isomerase/epimerase [Planctomycetota bacterium]
MQFSNRRQFIQQSAAAGAFCALSARPLTLFASDSDKKMRLGLVTYLWGKDMDLRTLIEACEKSGVLGLELRTQHKHGVEPSLSKSERKDVKKRFADSPVELVGYGSNAQFHEDDPAAVRQNIELAKQFVNLMHDCGGTGVKVKPNDLVKGVPHEKTIAQIGRSLNHLAAYAADYGQEIRVEAHGRGTSELPIMKAIFDVADHPNVGVCWNSNDVDVKGEGLEHNFNLVKERFGDTVHIRELNVGSYPYAKLMKMFVEMKYKGWILLECRTNPKDKIKALIEQREVFTKMIG